MTKKSHHKNKDFNVVAGVGFGFSIISIFGLGLAGLIGFILGIVALVQIKYTHESGRGLAIAAIAIGLVYMLLPFLRKLLL
ncbi:DUF4190 domain-containing protein [Patescibacteria group bacterium]|nr:DUF4190 domain-containing protein [Patescibacteria group bacterium]